MSAVEIRALTAAEATAVPSLWNAAWGNDFPESNPYPLGERLWAERLASRHHDPSLLIGAFDATDPAADAERAGSERAAGVGADGRGAGSGSELCAVAYGKAPCSTWQAENLGWVSLLAVAPHRQGRGLGTRLSARLLELLAARGVTAVHFGADADHLLPGPPQEASLATWRLIRRFGARFGAAEHDLHLDLRPGLPEAPMPPSWRLRFGDSDGAVAAVDRLFPGRWAEEVRAYVAAGAVPATLERTDERGGSSSAEAAGFCAIFLGDEPITSPGLHWAEALERELRQRGSRRDRVKLAGIGPLGIDPAVRGAGVGLALVRGAAQHLRERGITDVVINWTGLTGFYGRLGARVWRTYQRAEAPMPSIEALHDLAGGGGPR